MFFELNQTDFSSHADDNIPYAEVNNIDEVITILGNNSIQLFKWFSDNQMKASKDKCHLAISNNEKVSMKIDNIKLENASSEKLLGIIIDSKLYFKEHLEGIIKKASRKVNLLSRITSYTNLTKQKLLMTSIFKSQFNYCPLVWMYHNRTINNKINRLHKRCLRIVYNDNKSSFQELLDKDKGVTIHVKNVRALAIEMFKVSNNYSNSMMSKIFDKRNNVFDFRNPSEFARRNVRSVFNGTESISFLGLKSGILYLVN